MTVSSKEPTSTELCYVHIPCVLFFLKQVLMGYKLEGPSVPESSVLSIRLGIKQA